MRNAGGRALLRLTLWMSGAALAMVCAGMTIPAEAATVQPCMSSVRAEPELIAGDKIERGHNDANERVSAENRIGSVSEAAAPGRNAVSSSDHDNFIIPLSDADIELLARVISAEARGESFDGQVAVGAVILNRVKSDGFPDSVSEVCHQPGAFCGVEDGQVNIEPSLSCIDAAHAAARGCDPTGGAVFFYNPKTAASEWIRSRPVVVTIGNHCFCV